MSSALALHPAIALAAGGNTGVQPISNCANPPSGAGDSYVGTCGSDPGGATGGDITIVEDVTGLYTAGGFSGTANADASRNRVLFQSGTVQRIYGGYATATDSHATDNAVIMTGGQAEGVYGGFSSERAAGNTVDIRGGTVSSGIVSGGTGRLISATDNRVEISGTAQILGDVYGGQSLYQAADNTVLVSGTAQILGDVYGGYANRPGGNAIGNRVILSGTPTLTGSTLYGGYALPSGTSTGNVLEVRTTGLTAKNVDSFQAYHFILPADVTAGATVLTLNDGSGTNLSNTKIGVALAAGGNVLQSGDRVTLIRNDNGVATDSTIQRADMSGYQGVSLRYTFDVSADDKNLYATATRGGAVMDQTKAPVEGRASTMALASQGSDLAGGAGMARAVAATEGVSGTASFGATAGGSSRYHSGSHVDADGLSVMIGAAKRYPAATGQWMAGVFLEGGWGSYDTYNDFANQPTVRGHGKSHYFGGGALLRRDWAGAGQAGPYAEGSLRVGRVASDWRSRDMIGSADASYDTSALYYGAHLGAGYVLPLNARTSIDAHVKGFWTHQNGDSVTIAGDPYAFKAMDSFRTRLGLRLNRALTEQITGYVGAAWEHEFDGQARATTYGLDTPSPSLKGDTGVFEIGFDMKPKADGPLTVGLGAQAYTGMREGFGGTAKLMFVF